MKQPGSRHLLCSLLLVATGGAGAGDMPAEKTVPSLPNWQALEYEQRAFMVTARSRLELSGDATDPAIWRLQANSAVASNSEDVMLTLAATDGRAQRRERYSQGKDKRYKTYDYLPTMVVRERFDPPRDTHVIYLADPRRVIPVVLEHLGPRFAVANARSRTLVAQYADLCAGEKVK